MRGFDRNALLVSSAIVCMMAATPAAAQTKTFDVPAQAAQSAINALGRQADIQIIAARKVTRGKRTNAVRGNLTVQQALSALLEGTGLTYRQTGPQTYTVVEDQQTSAGSQTHPERQISSSLGEEPDDSAEIVVTGTNIRGANPRSSPVSVYTREEIVASGHSNVEQFFRTVPQNTPGGVSQENFNVVGAGADQFQQGSGINLRGLGQRATLTLLDGHRIAPSGLGSFVDVSMIPLSALERIEILTDGASAIYGSDAVGGVVNFILRDDFSGLESSALVGTAEGSGGNEVRLSQLAGTSWATGHALIAYEFSDTGAVKARSRSFSVNLPDDTFVLPGERRHSLRWSRLFGQFCG